MKVVNIFRKKEYFMLFKFFLLNFITILLISDYIPNEFPKKVYRISFTIFSLYNIYCIFIESSFDNKFLQILQIKLHKINLYFASFLGFVSAILLLLFYYLLIIVYTDYKKICPFLLTNFGYKMHVQRRCELYNINSTNYLPYQYICSFIPESEIRRCSKVEKIIENNEVVDAFIKEYYKEQNLYYCDLKRQPSFPSSSMKVDPILCNKKVIIYPELFVLLDFYFGIRCMILISSYFNSIEPNINHYEYLHLL